MTARVGGVAHREQPQRAHQSGPGWAARQWAVLVVGPTFVATVGDFMLYVHFWRIVLVLAWISLVWVCRYVGQINRTQSLARSCQENNREGFD